MNFPVLKTAVQTGSDLEITYDLDVVGSDSDEYRIEFFANERSSIFGYGPGQTYLGSHTTSSGSGKSVTLDVGVDNFSNMSLSATATALDSTSPTGFGDTSEFSQNILIGSDVDFDADTIDDSVEDLAPNDGDGNGDSIQDSLQSTVSSFISATSGDYTTFETGGCFSNGYVDSVPEESLGVTDTGFEYPFGLTDFTLNCSRGDTVTINKYIFTDETDIDGYSVRKFNPITDEFSAVPDSTIDLVEIGGENAIHMSYELTDGEFGDDDGEVNGVIVDPVGLAAVFVSSTPSVNNPSAPPAGGSTPTNSAIGTLATTGSDLTWPMGILAAVLIAGGFALIASTKKKA